jgi:hypothetical protein
MPLVHADINKRMTPPSAIWKESFSDSSNNYTKQPSITPKIVNAIAEIFIFENAEPKSKYENTPAIGGTMPLTMPTRDAETVPIATVTSTLSV